MPFFKKYQESDDFTVFSRELFTSQYFSFLHDILFSIVWTFWVLLAFSVLFWLFIYFCIKTSDWVNSKQQIKLLLALRREREKVANYRSRDFFRENKFKKVTFLIIFSFTFIAKWQLLLISNCTKSVKRISSWAAKYPKDPNLAKTKKNYYGKCRVLKLQNHQFHRKTSWVSRRKSPPNLHSNEQLKKINQLKRRNKTTLLWFWNLLSKKDIMITTNLFKVNLNSHPQQSLSLPSRNWVILTHLVEKAFLLNKLKTWMKENVVVQL